MRILAGMGIFKENWSGCIRTNTSCECVRYWVSIDCGSCPYVCEPYKRRRSLYHRLRVLELAI